MSHILQRLGAAALRRRPVTHNITLPPVLSRRRAMEVRREWLAAGRCASDAFHREGAELRMQRCAALSSASLEALQACRSCYSREWPFEHLVPGPVRNDPPYRGGYMKGHKDEKRREERRKHIEQCMAKMPQLIAEYKASRKLNWDEVSPVDKLLLSRKQIKEKYLKKGKK